MSMMRRICLFATTALLIAGAARAEKQTLTVDLADDAATLDPQVQWDTDSYTAYRNVFDNLVTRDVNGKIYRKSRPRGATPTTPRSSLTCAATSSSRTGRS